MSAIWAFVIWVVSGMFLVISGISAFLSGPPDADLARHGPTLRREAVEVSHLEVAAGAIIIPLTVLAAPGPGNDWPVFLVLHDDEDDAFDVAVAAMLRHGGRVIAVEAGEKRHIGGVDPNRIFGRARYDGFSQFFADLSADGRPLIALHNNRDGYGGRQGGVSIRRWQARPGRFTAFDHGDDEDNFILTSGIAPAPRANGFLRFRKVMKASGINVVYERAEGSGDYSMSLWAARRGLAYYNVEAEHGARMRQGAMLDILMAYLVPPRVS